MSATCIFNLESRTRFRNGFSAHQQDVEIVINIKVGMGDIENEDLIT